MATKKTKPTDAELSAMFEGLETDDADTNPSTTTTTPLQTATTKKAAPNTHTNTTSDASTETEEDDPLAELKTLATGPRTSTSSRPNTPRLASSATASTRTRSPAGHRSDLYTPTTGSGRSSEEKAADTHAADAEAQRIYQAPQTQGATSEGGGGGWWGGFTAIASAAVKQGQAALQEIQRNEEAQRWAEQMRGNVGALRGIGSKALPTFTNILHTLAPPISRHERLQIHITHDLVSYPSLDPLIYQTFSRVMSQVEGGDLMVIQRGSEASHKRSPPEGYTGGSLGSGTGWSDGPWWRQDDGRRSLGAVNGLVAGTKLARASAEGYGTDFFASKGGVEEAAKAAAASLSESNPTRSSDIFLAIQPISYTAEKELFAAGAIGDKKAGEEVVVDEEVKDYELVCFAVYLHDPIHGIAFSALSQAFPVKWAEWLDAKVSREAQNDEEQKLPDEISEIIENDGVDPREWVAEWTEETIGLAVGVVAQRYVARRMGVGEGGIGRGKRREVVEESGAGEAARAL